MSNTKLFGITGSPISKSLSPEIWNSAFEKYNIDAVYLRLCVGSMDEALSFAKELGLKALNVTSPFKQDVNLELGAVNSVIFKKDDSLEYLNTDVEGFLRSYNDIKYRPELPALVLGAGGAARSAVLALKKAGAKNISLANRTKNKAEKLCAEYGLDLLEWEKVNNDLKDKYNIFSCISSNNVLDTPFDSNYYKTDFGKRWLCYQAQSLFKRFYDHEPFEVMSQALNRAVNEKKKKTSIALVGFMGAGKSLIAKGLSSKLGYDLVDLDLLIEQREGHSISDIFANKGEQYFREVEKEVLIGLNLDRPMVLATGGGVVTDAKNTEYLSKNFTVVWLWASFSSICVRVQSTDRPLFKDGLVQELFDKRKPLYAKVSDLCVNNSCCDQQEIVDLIIKN